MTAQPEVRAAFLKEALQSFRSLGEGPDRAAFVRMPEQVPREIIRAGSLDWLPAGHALAILRAIEEEAGLEGVRVTSAATIEGACRAPLLRAFLEAAAAALGAGGPALLLRSATFAWPLHYRHAGDLVVASVGEGELRLLHPGLPEPLRVPCWLTSMATCIGRIAAIGADGATCEARDEGGGRIAYVVRWPVARRSSP